MSRKVRTRFGNTNRGPVRDEDHMMSGGLGPEPAKEPVKAKSARANGKSASKTAPKPNGILRASKSAVPVEEESWETEDDEEEVDEDEDDEDEEDDDDEEDAEEVLAALKSKMPDISRLLDSDSDDSSDEDEAVDEAEDDEDEEEEVATETNGALLPVTEDADEEKDDEDDEDDEEDIPLSDIASVASDERGDLVPYQRLTINNTTALTAAWKRIALPLSTLPFSAHQSITTAEPVQIEDVEDDLSRELAFYKQALNAVQASRPLLQKENIPFSRPTDYFAEMVKSDEHMGRVKQKLVDAAAGKKASAEAKRQRNLKKFGKQVQVAKLQERAKEKRETLDKIGALKRSKYNLSHLFTPLPDETFCRYVSVPILDRSNRP